MGGTSIAARNSTDVLRQKLRFGITLADSAATWGIARSVLFVMGYEHFPATPSTAWQRFPAAGKSPSNRSAAARLTDDGSAVHVVDHANDYRTTIQGEKVRLFDPVAVRRARVAADERAAAERAEVARVRFEAVSGLRRTLTKASPGDGHPYVVRKALAGAHGAVQVGGTLYVVGRDEHGALAFGQRIAPDGSKCLVRGTSFSGAWFTFGAPINGERVVIATGWATSAVVFEDTGTPTLAAMSDGNFATVAETARRLWPDSPLVICGDDDRHNIKNSGRESAEHAARTVGAGVLFPSFCCSDCTCSDFADVRACDRREVRS